MHVSVQSHAAFHYVRLGLRAVLISDPDKNCGGSLFSMESIRDDPELAQEMVTLLGRELKTARRTIEELKIELVRKVQLPCNLKNAGLKKTQAKLRN